LQVFFLLQAQYEPAHEEQQRAYRADDEGRSLHAPDGLGKGGLRAHLAPSSAARSVNGTSSILAFWLSWSART
jgi:hypothetical protein